MDSSAPNEASAPDSKEETVALAPLPTPGTVGQASAGPKLEAKQVKVAESATDPNSSSNVAVKVQVNVESQVKTTRKNVDHDENGRRRKRRTSMKKIKYVEEDDISEEEEALIAEKKQRARQLDHQLRTDGGYPELDQIVGRRINASSGLVEYLCKFLGRSYLHLYWLTFDELELFIPEGYQKFHRVQVYDRKLRREGYQSLDEVDDLEANKLTVEKIMNHKVDPADHLDEQIEKRRRQLPFEPKFPRVTDYFLIDNTDALSERMMGIATKLMKEPGGDIFEHPVDVEEVPDYLNFITNPIDLGTIATRIGRESYYVGPTGVSLFASDVRRVFHNCKVYNAEGSDIWRIADGLLRCFEKWLFDWLLCPSAWLKLPPTGDSKKDKEFQKDFRGQAEDSYDLWAPWQARKEFIEKAETAKGETLKLKSVEAKLSEDGVLVDPQDMSADDKSTTSSKPIPNILIAHVGGDGKFNKRTSSKRSPKHVTAAGGFDKTVSMKDRAATFFLVKWVGLSVRYSTWERPEDIGDDEQIQRYFKFSRVPSAKEICETTCQLPCCAKRHQSALATSTSGKKCCVKDRFCTLGYGHESECSRNMKAMGGAYGSAAYQKLHMAEQVKAQLFAFHCLLNNHTPDKDVLKQCGVYTNAYVTTKQYLKPKTSKEDEDEDYSEDDDSESSDDEADLDFPQRPALYPGILTLENDDEDENEESGGHRKKLEVEVGEVLSSIVEHVALGYPTKLETPSAQVRFNSTFPPTPLCMLPTFTEYAVILRRSPFGLGMRLGVSNTNNVSVLGFQTLANGMLGPAEASRSIAIGDVLVAVNSISVAGLTFKDVVGLIGASSDNIRFHFHSARPAFMFPPYCQTKQVTMAQDGISDDVVSSDSKYAAYSFNKYKPMLKVGNAAPDVASSASTQTLMQHSNYITPSGPMQHLYAGIVDNSIDPHEHFASFLPERSIVGGTQNSSSSAGDNGDEFVPYEQSPTYKGGRTLRSYQVEGLNWMVSCIKAQRSCILADEMGLGKTVQIVSLIEHMKSEESIRGPYLIVVPLSTIQHWRREIESWTDLNVCVYHDIGDKTTKFTAKDMRSVIRDQEWYYPGLGNSIFKFHILLTTFETILADFEEFEHIHWRLIVVDEAHRLKGAGSRVLKQMRVLHVDRKVLLTGTPLQNNTQELWVLLNYLEPVKFASMEEFNKNFGRLHSQEQVVKLQQLLAPYILRRVKEDVEKSIPPKEETIISVELTTLQKQYYRAIYDKNKSFLYRGTKNGLPTLNNIQLQLRKCCNHPFLIKGVEKRELDELGSRPTPTQIMEKTIQCSGKMMLVSKLIPKLKRDGHKILIFSQFLKQLDLLERYCEANSFVFERLDGSTGGSMRQSAIDRFSRPHSKSFIFLLSTKAGGVGINLIAADTVIIFDSDWNPMNDLQAQSRCHRIGQKKSVQIYRLVTHNTESSQISKPSAEQLVELLKRGAYALMEDDDTASKEFAERDIETILKENARVLVVEGSTGELSVDDPNFWEKVLPGAVSVEMLSLKLEDGSAMSSRQSKIKFISNLDIALTSLIAEMSSGNISDDGGVGSRDIQHEYDIAIQVLSTVSSKYRDEFSNEQIDLVKGYLTKLEKSRVGEMGAEFGVTQCSVAKCGRFYHKGCLAKNSHVEWVGKKRFRCPSHFCHSCSLSSQQSSSTKKKKKKKKDDTKVIVSCIHCSQAFHPDCIPSAEKFIRLSKSLMICANHLSGKKPTPGASAGKLSESSHRAGATLAVAAVQQRLEVPEAIPLNEDDDLEEPMPSPSGKINGKRKRPASLTKANATGPKKSKSVASKPSKPKLCALCSRGNVMGGGEGGQVLSTKKGARNGSVGESADTVGAATADMALEGPFIEAPVRLKYVDKPQESVYVHLNCAVHSPEVYVKADGLIMNLPKAIKRGRQLKCTSCHKFGATVGCVVAKCRCNYHLRCAVESGGEIDGTTYALYCRPHAASRKEPVRVCTCDATDEDDPTLSLVCSSCSTKFHPKCVGMSERHAARKAKSWVCTVCDGSAVNKPKPAVLDPKLKAPSSASSTSRSSSKSSKDPASTTTKTESNGTAISKPTNAPKRKKPNKSRLTTPRNKSKAAGGASHTQGISPHMDADSDSDVSTDE
ncbi:hypothetical protein BBP00_00001225 [Phytophthora kernoviae]|uniref:Chromodomain-helicase-DNA-binding protein 9 n=1 Tax=Phytophthora kernoviae TaxID=325452 RepID=A0A3F2S0Y2_9STRA|nr:hypothetical protein BBP00_00001225 [Phytophthora kernoviae]